MEIKWNNEVLSRLDVCESLKLKDPCSISSRWRLDGRASILFALFLEASQSFIEIQLVYVHRHIYIYKNIYTYIFL